LRSFSEKIFFVGVEMSFCIDNQVIMYFYVGKNCLIVAQYCSKVAHLTPFGGLRVTIFFN